MKIDVNQSFPECTTMSRRSEMSRALQNGDCLTLSSIHLLPLASTHRGLSCYDRWMCLYEKHQGNTSDWLTVEDISINIFSEKCLYKLKNNHKLRCTFQEEAWKFCSSLLLVLYSRLVWCMNSLPNCNVKEGTNPRSRKASALMDLETILKMTQTPLKLLLDTSRINIEMHFRFYKRLP